MRRWLSWKKTRRYEATLYRQFALCTMVSEADRAATLSVLKDAATRVETVPNGVDCAYNRPGIAPVTPGSLVFNESTSGAGVIDATCFSASWYGSHDFATMLLTAPTPIIAR